LTVTELSLPGGKVMICIARRACVLLATGFVVFIGSGCEGEGDGSISTTGLALVFPQDSGQVVCRGRTFDCVPYGDQCYVDLDAGAQGWSSEVILCQAATETPIAAPAIPLAYKGGIPLWAPNLDSEDRVFADDRSMAVSMAFLSPHLLTTSPERAKFLLDMIAVSPYLDGLVAAVASGDTAAMGEELPRVVADVLAQTGIEAALSGQLTTTTRTIDMTHVGMDAPGGNLSLAGLAGSPVDFLCRVSQAESCILGMEPEFLAADRYSHLGGDERWRIWVPANSYFKNLKLISRALGEFWKLVLPEPGETPPEHVLSPDSIYDVQCYSGSFGGGTDEKDADWAFIGAEPDAVTLHNMARAGNLVALATETLRLFMDFELIDSSTAFKTISSCSLKSMGEGMELSANLSVDDMMVLVWDVQWCVVESLVKKQVSKGVMALAGFVLGNLMDKVNLVQKIGKVGVMLDRLVGMTLTISPLERALLAHEVDFESCSGCIEQCLAAGLKECVDESHYSQCEVSQTRPGCLDLVTYACGSGKVCLGDDLCVDCGGEGEPCCPGGTCSGGFGCEDGECGAATCEHECWPPVKQCGDAQTVESCGECDADDCFDFCFHETCGDKMECQGGACTCMTGDPDLPGGLPALDLGPLDDTGVSVTVLDSLWPEAERDLVGAYVADAGGFVRPRVEVEDLGYDVVHDVCIAYVCDPNVNDGIMDSYDCPGGVKTTMYGFDACCMYDRTGDTTVEMSALKCTFLGSGDDSGTAVARVESVQGEQCWPRYRITLYGG